MKNIAKKITLRILSLIARGILWRYNPKVIAVTGSVGKTSTKDAIYTVLKSSGGVRRSEKSFNSEFGVPLSIIGASTGWNNPLKWLATIAEGISLIIVKQPYPKTLVLEVGADRPGDISSIAQWLRPHISVITRLPDIPVHIEFFPTLDSLIEEKLSLAVHTRKEGTLVLNADDKRVMQAKEKLPLRAVTFGVSEEAMIRASNVQILAPSDASGESPAQPGGLNFKLNYDGKSLPVTLPDIYAESFVTVALAALAVAYASGVNMVTAIGDLASYKSPAGRVRLLPGAEGTILIDDTYNASPAATEAGLDMLHSLPFGGRKIAILGDMLELGKHTTEAHMQIGMLAKKKADLLIAVGLRGKEYAAGAREAKMAEKKIYEVSSAEEAGELMQKLRKTGDVIFIKGSQGMRMERAVKMLMAEPERAKELLVRQDTEWKKR